MAFQCPLQLFPYRTQAVVVVEEREEFNGEGEGRLTKKTTTTRGESRESPIDYGGRGFAATNEEEEVFSCSMDKVWQIEQGRHFSGCWAPDYGPC